jgi:hypothetical protein
MNSVESMKKQILTYFGTISSPAHGTLTIRDFNSQLMSKMFHATDRESLSTALDELIAEGLVVERSQKTYGDAEGRHRAGESKAARRRSRLEK